MEETVSSAFNRFLQQPGRSHSTKQKFRYKFKLFLEEHGRSPISTITAETIEAWFAFLEERKGYSEGHLAFHRSCHTTFWSWLGLDIVHVRRYSEIPAVIITASDQEIKKLLDTCNLMWATIHQQRDAAIIALGTAGLRRSNIRLTRTSNTTHALANPITANGRSYYLLHTHGKENMTAVLDTQRATIIQRYLSNRPPTRHDRLFLNLNPDDSRYLEPLSNEGLIRARRHVCQAAGLRLISFQQMRRWLGTKIARTNSIHVAAQALGHKSGITVILNHYYNPDADQTRTAVLDAYLF